MCIYDKSGSCVFFYYDAGWGTIKKKDIMMDLMNKQGMFNPVYS